MTVVSGHCVRVDKKLHVLGVVEHQAQPLDLAHRVYDGVLDEPGLGAIGCTIYKKGNIKQYILRIHVVYPLMRNLNIMNPNIVARITAKRRANWTTERFFLAKLLKTSAKDVIAASETYRRS